MIATHSGSLSPNSIINIVYLIRSSGGGAVPAKMPGTRRLEQLRRLRGGAAAHFGHRKMCQRVRRVLGHLRCVVQKQEKRKRKLIPNYFDFIFPSIPPRWIFNFSNSISSISSDSDIAIISQIIQLSSLSFIHKIIHFVVYKVTLEKNVKIIAGYHRQRVCSCHPFIHPFFSAKSLLFMDKVC